MGVITKKYVDTLFPLPEADRNLTYTTDGRNKGTTKGDPANNVAEHHTTTGHDTDWNSARSKFDLFFKPRTKTGA